MAKLIAPMQFDPDDVSALASPAGPAALLAGLAAMGARRTAGLPSELWRRLRGKVKERIITDPTHFGVGVTGEMQTVKTPRGNRYLIETMPQSRTEEWRHAAIREAEDVTGRPAFGTREMSEALERQGSEGRRIGKAYTKQYRGDITSAAEEIAVREASLLRQLARRMRGLR